MFTNKAYEIGELVKFPATQEQKITIGENDFLNLSVPNSIPVGAYPEMLAKVPEKYTRNSASWGENPNWHNFMSRPLCDQEFIIQNLARQHSFASNGKSGSDLLMCYVSDNVADGIIVGNYEDNFTIIAIPEEFFSVEYYSVTDTWFFGGLTGAIFKATSTELEAGTAPSAVAGTPVTGWSHAVLSLYHVKATDTLIATSYNAETARSTDDGVTWASVTTAPTYRGRGFAEDASGNLVMVTLDDRSYMSTDDGDTWVVIPYTNLTSNNNYRVGCNPDTGRFIWSADQNTIYTIDDINSSQRKLHTFPNEVACVLFAGGKWYVSQNPESLLDPGLPVVYTSSDDGETWDAITQEAVGWLHFSTSTAWMYYDNAGKILITTYEFKSVTVGDLNTDDTENITLPITASDVLNTHVFVCVR